MWGREWCTVIRACWGVVCLVRRWGVSCEVFLVRWWGVSSEVFLVRWWGVSVEVCLVCSVTTTDGLQLVPVCPHPPPSTHLTPHLVTNTTSTSTVWPQCWPGGWGRHQMASGDMRYSNSPRYHPLHLSHHLSQTQPVVVTTPPASHHHC